MCCERKHEWLPAAPITHPSDGHGNRLEGASKCSYLFHLPSQFLQINCHEGCRLTRTQHQWTPQLPTPPTSHSDVPYFPPHHPSVCPISHEDPNLRTVSGHFTHFLLYILATSRPDQYFQFHPRPVPDIYDPSAVFFDQFLKLFSFQITAAAVLACHPSTYTYI